MAGRSSRSSGGGSSRSQSSFSSSRSNQSYSAPQSNGHSQAGTNQHRSASAAPVVATPASSSVAPMQHAPVDSSRPGFLSNVIQTATGVAIGHTVGHAITGTVGSLFGGGSSPQNNGPEMSAPSSLAPQSNSFDNNKNTICEPHLKSFMECMDRHHQDIAPCQFYMDMLKSCRGEAVPIQSNAVSSSW